MTTRFLVNAPDEVDSNAMQAVRSSGIKHVIPVNGGSVQGRRGAVVGPADGAKPWQSRHGRDPREKDRRSASARMCAGCTACAGTGICPKDETVSLVRADEALTQGQLAEEAERAMFESALPSGRVLFSR